MSGSRNRRNASLVLTNNTEGILGNDIQLTNAHGSSLRETEDYSKKARTVEDLCNRLKRMTEWIKENYPQYHQVGVVPLSAEQKADRKKYHRQEEDFIYKQLNVKMIQAFMSANKFKPGTTNQYGFVHIRKYHNAIQYGAMRAGESLPEQYTVEMTRYLNSSKKEKNQAKKDGQLDEKEADPISFSLYSSICEAAIKLGDIFP